MLSLYAAIKCACEGEPIGFILSAGLMIPEVILYCIVYKEIMQWMA